jgi:hypothetical protein
MSDDAELKQRFAAALLKFPQTMEGRFQAALSVTTDTGKALLMANKWIDDPEVTAAQTALVSNAKGGELDFIQTEAEFVREILTEARSCWDHEVKLKFYNLYAEVRGFKRNKADTQVNVQVNNNRVMVVRDMGTDAEWEEKARRQQRTLIDASAVTVQ